MSAAWARLQFDFGDEAPLIDILTARNVAVFAVDADPPGPLLKTIQIDFEHGIRHAVQHLAALGHERIAFIGPQKLKTTAMRKFAVQKMLKEIGLELLPELFVDGDHTIDAGLKALNVFDPSSGELLFTAKLNLAWDDNMRELRFIFTSVALPDGTPLTPVINGDARKMVP